MRKVAFLFPGQGAQKLDMCADIVEAYPSCEAIFETAQIVLGRDIREVMFGDDEAALNKTENTQVCLLAAELCSWEVASEEGLEPDAYIGFSLGEWAALVASGALDIETAFSVVEHRAAAMQDAVPEGMGGMLAIIGVPDNEVQRMCDQFEDVWPSNFNSDGQVVVSGLKTSIDELAAQCDQREIKNVLLAVSVPSHCPLMQPAADVLASVLTENEIRNADKPIIMNATGEFTTDADEIRRNMVLQLTNPVLFKQSVGLALEDGIDAFIELGPGRVLSKLVQRADSQAQIFRISNIKTLGKTLSALK